MIGNGKMSYISTVDARNQFADLLNRAKYGKERLPIVRRGKVVAVLVPEEDMQLLESLDTPEYTNIRESLRSATVSG